MAEPANTWRAGGASVIGAAHLRRKLPNQDAVHWQPGNGVDDRCLIAVADGHGGAAHFRSDVGAGLAVEAVRSTLEWYFDEPESLDQLPGAILEVWRREVREHVAANPFREVVSGSSLEPYGSTLVAVAATARFCWVFQIGDGDLYVAFPDGRIEKPLGDDVGLTGEMTYSLCMEEAQRHVRSRIYRVDAGQQLPDFALVATDGVSKSFVDDQAFYSVVRDYRDIVQTKDDLDSTLAALPGWLREVSDNGSGDDASLCIAFGQQAE